MLDGKWTRQPVNTCNKPADLGSSKGGNPSPFYNSFKNITIHGVSERSFFKTM
jgi:hypothetical protein